MYLSRETILEISIAIERKGIEFYKTMKTRMDDDFIDFMIEQERQHIRVFSDVFSAEKGKVTDQLDNDYLDDGYIAAAYANTEIFSLVDPDTVETDKLLDVAISMEKNSLLFYTELIDVLPEKYQTEIGLIKGIREEEKGHLRMLVKRKMGLAT